LDRTSIAPAASAIQLRLRIRAARQDDDRHVPQLWVVAQGRQQFHAGQVQVQVQQQQPRPLAAHQRDGFPGIACLHEAPVADIRQEGLGHFDVARLVVDHHDQRVREPCHRAVAPQDLTGRQRLQFLLGEMPFSGSEHGGLRGGLVAGGAARSPDIGACRRCGSFIHPAAPLRPLASGAGVSTPGKARVAGDAGARAPGWSEVGWSIVELRTILAAAARRREEKWPGCAQTGRPRPKVRLKSCARPVP
jgi:hypothetical protein